MLKGVNGTCDPSTHSKNMEVIFSVVKVLVQIYVEVAGQNFEQHDPKALIISEIIFLP